MSLRIQIRPRAMQEIDDLAEYFALQASAVLARRFLRAVEDTIARIAEMPGLGSPWESDDPALVSVRVWPVRRFRKYLMFYRVHEDTVDILRVLHGSRDQERQLRNRR